MRRVAALVIPVILALAACGGGGGGSAASVRQHRFVLLMHSPLSGTMAARSDADLLALGQQACSGLAAHQSSDAIVTTMSGDALPGSAAFNDAAFLVATAGTNLCPENGAELQQTIPTEP